MQVAPVGDARAWGKLRQAPGSLRRRRCPDQNSETDERPLGFLDEADRKCSLLLPKRS